jgi:hypothetical protein
MRARILLIPLVMVVAFAAGCTKTAPTPSPTGIAALPVDQILAQAKEALKATTFHLKGSPAPNISIDMHHKGEDAKGTFDVAGQLIEVTYVSKDLYLKASDDFWKQNIPADKQAQVLPLVSGKWGKVNAANPAYANDIPSLDGLFQLIGTPTKGDATNFYGTPALTIVGSNGGQLYVATQGAPVILRISGRGTDINLTEFGSAITVEAPSAGDVVDLTPYTS